MRLQKQVMRLPKVDLDVGERGPQVRATALAEIAIYRDVSTAVMAHLGRILGWSRPKAALLAASIQAVYLRERLGGWRRMVSLGMPARRNALGGPAGASPVRAAAARPGQP